MLVLVNCTFFMNWFMRSLRLSRGMDVHGKLGEPLSGSNIRIVTQRLMFLFPFDNRRMRLPPQWTLPPHRTLFRPPQSLLVRRAIESALWLRKCLDPQMERRSVCTDLIVLLLKGIT